jgi:putative DNA primase/helicase
MMKAAAIAYGLGHARRSGAGYMTTCPAHDDSKPSLWVADGYDGRPKFHCFAGCSWFEVSKELLRRGLVEGEPSFISHNDYRIDSLDRRQDDLNRAHRIGRALHLWDESSPARGTIVQRYLAHRGIELHQLPQQLQNDLHFHPACPHPDAAPRPAMLLLMRDVEGLPTAVHRTFLKANGTDKVADVLDRASLGPIRGTTVRIGEPAPSLPLTVAEGFETAASVFLASGWPTWAAISAGNFNSLTLPPYAIDIVIAADNDLNQAGQRAAGLAAARLRAEGRRVTIAMPSTAGCDFNDVYVMGLHSAAPEANRNA